MLVSNLLKKKSKKLRVYLTTFSKIVLKKTVFENSSLEQFLRIAFNCFQEQNSVWGLEYEKLFFQFTLGEDVVHLYIM